jgi:NAD(P)-dependent dehydrogenase (short-subunit alcohol dehydrogenase family)
LKPLSTVPVLELTVESSARKHNGLVVPLAMKNQLTILTGASRGLGLAMAEQLIAPHSLLITMSRAQPDLPSGNAHVWWQADLAEPAPLAQRLGQWLAEQDPAQWQGVTLIHNAALLPEPAVLGQGPEQAHALSQAVRVGLEAPLLLSEAFLRTTARWSGPRKLLFVSSGLGRFAMSGASTYCAVKAGIDHLARTIALEQSESTMPTAAKVVSLAPGVIDTDMQVPLRGANAAHFPNQGRFASMHAQGALDTPHQAAEKVLAYLNRPDFGSTVIADVREA